MELSYNGKAHGTPNPLQKKHRNQWWWDIQWYTIDYTPVSSYNGDELQKSPHLISQVAEAVDETDMQVSINGSTPKSSILVGFSFTNHPFWDTPISGKRPHVQPCSAKDGWHLPGCVPGGLSPAERCWKTQGAWDVDVVSFTKIDR